MSKALSCSSKEIKQWLGAQLVDRPQPANHPGFTMLLGGSSPFKSVRDLLDSLINQSEWSWEVELAHRELGSYFSLPNDWWKNREGAGMWLVEPMAAVFADAWIYRHWLRERDKAMSDAYAEFFAKTVMHPEWFKALESLWPHYPLVGGNLYEILPTISEMIYPEQLERTPWYPFASG